MANFPIPTSGTAWASGGISGRVGSSKMQRRQHNRFRGPRVPRIDKYWVPNTTTPLDDPISLGGSTNTPELPVIIKHVFYDTSQDGGTALSRGLGGKLWRIDGFIKAYLNPLDTAYTVASPMMSRVMYFWMLQKTSANTYDGSTLGNSSDFAPAEDWQNIMRRDDVLRWGTVDVYGPVPDAQSSIPVVHGISSTVAFSTSLINGDVLVNKRAYPFRGDAHIPLPRIPKAGLNLKSGVELALYTQVYNLTDSMNVTGSREVLILPRFRMLLSR